MGYHTEFSGRFDVTPALRPEHIAYLKAFNNTRRMKRDSNKTFEMPDRLRIDVGLPLGRDAEFFVGAPDGPGFDCAGQAHTPDILDYNKPPATQPGLWCHWTPTDDGLCIQWSGGEKFYDYTARLNYLIENFLKPWDYKISGEVEWQGEESSDSGVLQIVKGKAVGFPNKVVRTAPKRRK